MKKFKVTKPTGFIVLKNPVKILDENKRPFYETLSLTKNIKAFNMPKGTYFLTAGKIKPLNHIVGYSLNKLPKKERIFMPNIDSFDFVVDKNPSKCTIFWNEKKILFDKDFVCNLTRSEINFILYHEKGHEIYGTEKYADLYASNQMLKRGFNPSQIAKAILTTLSPKQYGRKEFIADKMISLRQ